MRQTIDTHRTLPPKDMSKAASSDSKPVYNDTKNPAPLTGPFSSLSTEDSSVLFISDSTGKVVDKDAIENCLKKKVKFVEAESAATFNI